VGELKIEVFLSCTVSEVELNLALKSKVDLAPMWANHGMDQVPQSIFTRGPGPKAYF
jgi:hypothetical protein